jgi:lactoylglutathione lyase
MPVDAKVVENVIAVVPFLGVSDMEQSVCYYVDGLGFTMTNKWIDNGKLRWCWLEKGGAALMLQEFWREGPHTGRPDGKLGQGVSLAFQCRDAL